MSKSKGVSVSEWVSEWVSDKVTYWAVCGQLKMQILQSGQFYQTRCYETHEAIVSLQNSESKIGKTLAAQKNQNIIRGRWTDQPFLSKERCGNPISYEKIWKQGSSTFWGPCWNQDDILISLLLFIDASKDIVEHGHWAGSDNCCICSFFGVQRNGCTASAATVYYTGFESMERRRRWLWRSQ